MDTPTPKEMADAALRYTDLIQHASEGKKSAAREALKDILKLTREQAIVTRGHCYCIGAFGILSVFPVLTHEG